MTSKSRWLMKAYIHYIQRSRRSHLAAIHHVLMTRGTCRASARYVHYGTRATCHVNVKRKLLVALWKMSVTQMRLAKWKKSCGPSFSIIILNSTYPFVWARLFLPSEASRVPSPFNVFKRAYVEYSSQNLFSFECWKHSRINNGNWDYYYSSRFLRSL